MQKIALQSSVATSANHHKEAEATFQLLSSRQPVQKAPATLTDFAVLCKADPLCRNEAVWYNTELKIQYCEQKEKEEQW